MTWLKTSDRFYSEPGVTDLGFEVAGFHLTTMNFCADRLLDGYITEADVDYLARLYRCSTVASLIDKLLNAKLWERVETGYRIIDFLTDQPSRAQVLEQREKNRRDVADWRASHKPSKDVTSYKPASNRPVRVRVRDGLGKNTKRGEHLYATQTAKATTTEPGSEQPSTRPLGSSQEKSARDDNEKQGRQLPDAAARLAAREAADRLSAEIKRDEDRARRDLLARARAYELSKHPVKGLAL